MLTTPARPTMKPLSVATSARVLPLTASGSEDTGPQSSSRIGGPDPPEPEPPTGGGRSLGPVVEVAGAVAALAAVGALFFAWRTVVESRAAHAEDERDRRLSRIERLAVALTELAADLDSVATGRARITQARARVLWVTAGADFGEHVREAVLAPITTEVSAAAGLAEKARAASESVLTGLDDFLAA